MKIMKVYQKLTVENGWVSEFTRHDGFHGGALPTSAVMGLLSHTMVGNLPGTDDLFTPGPHGSGNSAHFGTAQDGTVIQWVPLGVVAEHAVAANPHWYAVENADDGDPNNPYTDAQLSRIAQILELTARPEYGRFAIQVTDSPDKEGLGTHSMGGAAFGGHSCPDADKNPNHTRSLARAEIVRRANIIRQHGQYPAPEAEAILVPAAKPVAPGTFNEAHLSQVFATDTTGTEHDAWLAYFRNLLAWRTVHKDLTAHEQHVLVFAHRTLQQI
ncbi:MAG TPA: N-acetylmuramoyl-L-alanine amidase [Streptosporangiaceae bacterium]|jgi:N-acetylmuramoyl-L-alanine amidase|nr:N-acetylmuramoyl-L-alanine amidase [Streptosporangiaceae bacterium]